MLAAALTSQEASNAPSEDKILAKNKIVALQKTLNDVKDGLDDNTPKSTIDSLNNGIRLARQLQRKLDNEILQSIDPKSALKSQNITTTTTTTTVMTTTTRAPTRMVSPQQAITEKNISSVHFSKDPSESNEAFISKLIRNKDSDVDVSFSGVTPLSYAIFTQNTKLVRQLLKAGAEPNQKAFSSPIIFKAIQAGQEEMALLLLEHGAKANVKNDSGIFPLEEALNGKMTQLSLAIFDKLSTIVSDTSNKQEVIKNRQEIVRNFDKYLGLAARAGEVSLLGKLFELNSPKRFSQGALSEAIRSQNPKCVIFLLERGADPNALDGRQWSPLEVAARENSMECFEALLKAGADASVLFQTKRVEFSVTINDSIIEELKMLNSPSYPLVINLLSGKYKKEILALEEKFRILAVGHSCKLRGIVNVKKNSLLPKKTWPAELEGGRSEHWLGHMSEITKLFSSRYPDLLSDEQCKIVCEVLDFSSQWVPPDEKKISDRILEGKPTFLQTGYLGDEDGADQGHSIVLTIMSPFVGLCDRRAKFKETPIVFHQFAPESFGSSNVAKLREARQTHTEVELQKLITKIRKSIGAEQTPVEEWLQTKCPLGIQIAANCSWDSAEGAVWNLFLFLKLSEKGLLDEMAKGSLSTDLEKSLENVLAEVNTLFYSWLAFNQLVHLQRYMAMEKFSEIPFRTEESSTRELFKPSKKLIRLAMNSVGRNKEKKIDRRILGLINSFEKKVERKF